MSIADTDIHTYLKSENSGLLCKQYLNYAGTRLMYTVKTYQKVAIGSPALKTSYKYSGSNIIGEYKEIVEWTQPMEDSAIPLAEGAFVNNLSTSFDGINERVNFGNNFNYDHSQAFSISMWVKPQNVSATRALYSKATSDANVYGIGLYHQSGGTILLQARAPSSLQQHVFVTGELTADIWHHVALTYTGGSNLNGFRLYINGVSGGTPSSAGFSNSWLSGQDALIGARNTSFHFSGSIDEFSVWNTNLSQSAVEEIYNSGTPTDLTSHSASNSLQNWYRMGENDTSPTIYDNVGVVDGTMVNMDSGNFTNDVPT